LLFAEFLFIGAIGAIVAGLIGAGITGVAIGFASRSPSTSSRRSWPCARRSP
jgi:hypothetical protein